MRMSFTVGFTLDVRRCLSGPQVICQVGVGIWATAHVEFEVFRYFLQRLTDLEPTCKERLEMSESLMEEMALEERNVVEEFKRVKWADLEDEELSSRYEQMAEKEEIMNRSETVTEMQNDSGNETWQGGQPATAREHEAVGGRRRRQGTARRSARARRYEKRRTMTTTRHGRAVNNSKRKTEGNTSPTN